MSSNFSEKNQEYKLNCAHQQRVKALELTRCNGQYNTRESRSPEVEKLLLMSINTLEELIDFTSPYNECKAGFNYCYHAARDDLYYQYDEIAEMYDYNKKYKSANDIYERKLKLLALDNKIHNAELCEMYSFMFKRFFNKDLDGAYGYIESLLQYLGTVKEKNMELKIKFNLEENKGAREDFMGGCAILCREYKEIIHLMNEYQSNSRSGIIKNDCIKISEELSALAGSYCKQNCSHCGKYR